MNYQKEWGRGYWGLGFYELDRAVNEISSSDLENFVMFRELYIVKWNWMKKFPPHQTYGKSCFSEWHNVFRYPKFNKLPRVIKTYEVNKGKIHITKGISARDFKLDLAKFPSR